MKKKFYGALLVGSLLLAGGMVSCSDYDDDINSLTGRVDALEKTVADLKTAIESGSVITNVQSTENGVTVTLSDGKTFELKNGTNGTNGADGADGAPGSVVTIDEEGYWCIDGVRQTDKNGNAYKAQSDGQDGQDGKDGCWYMPNEDGYWHKQYYGEDGTVVDEATENKWTDTIKKDVVCVVYDSENGRLLISNAAGMQEGEVVLIETWGELKSLAVIPYVIDKETSMPVVGFYNIVKDGTVLESTDATAHFRLNPNNANIKDWEWSIIDRKAVTRAEGDNVNDLLNISDITRADGEMIVSLKSKKSISDLNADEIAIFALNGTNTANGNNIASDYAKVTSKDLTNFAIVNASLTHEFAFSNPYPTTKPTEPAEDPVDPNTRIDAKLVYSNQDGIDLKDLVWTWAKDLNAGTSVGVTLEDLNIDGLTYTFEKPEKYIGHDGVTNQQDFVDLNGSVVTVNHYQSAAKGRTPIFIARAFVNGTEIAMGYIKLHIVDAEAVEKEDEVLTVNCGTIDYRSIVNGKVIAKLDWTTVNEFYSKHNLSAETFGNIYNDPVVNKTETGVTLDGEAWLNNQTTTAPATFALTNKVAVMGLQNAVRTAELKFTTKSGDNTEYPNIIVRFTYTIKDYTTFPALNDDYTIDVDGDGVKDNVVKVKGQLEGTKWAMISGIKEHFNEYLNGYERSANHYDLYATLVAGQTGATVEPAKNVNGNHAQGEETVMDQNIKLTTELTDAYKDYAVNLNMRLANGEDTTYTYTVRFERPYTVKVAAIELETLLAEASTADLSKKVVIYGPQNEIVYENGVVTEIGKATYKFDQSGYTIEYKDLTGSTEDTWASFGGNLKLNGTTISWYNQGTALQNDKLAHSNVVVTIPDVAVIKAQGDIVVKKSK